MLHRLRLIAWVPALTLVAACAVRLPASATWTGASGDPRVIHVTEASFAPDSRATAAVRAECGLERVVPQYLARWSPVPVVLAAETTGAARVLKLEITDIWAPRGGAWTGPKSLTVRGELRERIDGDWAVVASFEGRRTTARVGGTCEMLETVANALGKDVRAWLARPSLNAPLAARGESPRAASLGLFAEGGVAETCSTPGTTAFRLLALAENSGARRHEDFHHGLLGELD